ncbi:HET-domain-containing protein [Amniculicola lignicola CBS 123094]|uniref:HET-domain-containing protein n=1 Tax=Amniculicola lignicola CBS 123094 TaxID=1392246 RepID=A0A6A5W9A6_9PLEO|nr:HET-domain-containing protein [Amniculicola lignicola CBS 123094]
MKAVEGHVHGYPCRASHLNTPIFYQMSARTSGACVVRFQCFQSRDITYAIALPNDDVELEAVQRSHAFGRDRPCNQCICQDHSGHPTKYLGMPEKEVNPKLTQKTAKMTCTTCKDLTPPPDARNSSFTIPIKQCLRSAHKTPCDTCALLSEIVQYFHADEEDTITITRPQNAEDTLKVAVYADLDEDDVLLDLFVQEGEKSGHPFIRSSPRVQKVCASSGDEQCLDKIEGWLNECDENHENCTIEWMEVSSKLPTRVINVGLDGDEPFLLETEGNMEWYAALSYCWGKTPQLKTTKARLQEFKEELPWDELSLVTKDAIALCQKLTIPYLWVDALCIVQDDEEDWLREAGRMCNIYSGAYLTLAAAGAFDNTDGIFQDQYFGLDSRIAEFEFRGHSIFARVNPFQDHLGHPLGLNFEEQYDDRLAEKSWLLRPGELPLVHRAWTVQERMLSRCIVYFTHEEVWWECDSCWQCECGFANEEKYPGDANHEKYLQGLNVVQVANRGSFDWLRDPSRKVQMTLDSAHHKWDTVATMFAAGNLTYAKDKLPALSGLAHQFKRMLKGRFSVEAEYFAGLWRYNLERHLLWVVAGHIRNVKALGARQKEAFIPSWSWLSVDASVQFISDERDMNFKPRFRIVEISTESAGEDWAGPVKGGKLALEGLVIHGLELTGKLRHRLDRTVQVQIPGSQSFASVNKDIGDELTDGPYTCFYAADLASEDGPVAEINPNTGNMFMMLRPSSHIEGTFERIGMGVAALNFMMPDLWNGAKKETITIV